MAILLGLAPLSINISKASIPIGYTLFLPQGITCTCIPNPVLSLAFAAAIKTFFSFGYISSLIPIPPIIPDLIPVPSIPTFLYQLSSPLLSVLLFCYPYLGNVNSYKLILSGTDFRLFSTRDSGIFTSFLLKST